MEGEGAGIAQLPVTVEGEKAGKAPCRGYWQTLRPSCDEKMYRKKNFRCPIPFFNCNPEVSEDENKFYSLQKQSVFNVHCGISLWKNIRVIESYFLVFLYYLHN